MAERGTATEQKVKEKYNPGLSLAERIQALRDAEAGNVASNGNTAAEGAPSAEPTAPETPVEPTVPTGGNSGGYSGGGGGGSKAPAASDPLSTERNLIAPLANYDPAAYESYVAAMQALDAARGQAPTYNDTYGDQLSALYAEITGRDPFKYDLDSDPLYQQYRDQYMMQGQQAMMDKMGQAAALTGGYGSTYSQAVGQQQYNAYLQDLNQIVPDLYQNAYNRWLSEGDRLTQQYGILSDLSDRDYGMYRDQVSDYWTGVDYAQQQADLEYNRGLAEWERDYQLNEDARAQQAEDYDRLLQLMQIGYAPNADEIRAAGMSEAEAAAWQKYIKSQQGDGGYYRAPAKDSAADSDVPLVVPDKLSFNQYTDLFDEWILQGESKNTVIDQIKYDHDTGAMSDEDYRNLYRIYNNREYYDDRNG